MTVRGGSRGTGLTATLSLGTGNGATGNNLGNNLQQQFNPNPNAVDDLTVLVWCCGCKTKSLVGGSMLFVPGVPSIAIVSLGAGRG